MYLSGNSDFSTPLTKIVATRPQALYIVGVNVTPIIRQFKTYRTGVAIYTNNVPVSGNLIFTDTVAFDGVHLTGFKSTIPGTDQYIRIRQEIPTANATNTLGYSAAAYDDLMAIRAIMTKDPDPKNFVKTFTTLGSFDGINGGYNFTGKFVSMPLYPVVFKNGVLYEVK
jgi:ABC-type branched-subunit amino acid transport system substrate-binding protein